MIVFSFIGLYVNTSVVRVGIVGASGYTGAELLRLCAQHPDVEVVAATGDSQAGTLASHLYPSVAAAYPNLVFEEFTLDRFAGLDVVFLGVPHEAALDIYLEAARLPGIEIAGIEGAAQGIEQGCQLGVDGLLGGFERGDPIQHRIEISGIRAAAPRRPQQSQTFPSMSSVQK